MCIRDRQSTWGIKNQMDSTLKLAFFGAGYVGATSALVMAAHHPTHHFVVLDTNEALLSQWNRGEPPFHEPSVSSLLASGLSSNVTFSSDANSVLPDIDIIFLCVNTPTDPVTGNLDTTNLEQAVETILSTFQSISMTKNVLIVEKSTVPVGTAAKLGKRISSFAFENPNNKDYFAMMSNPEFLAQGRAIACLTNPDRVVIGPTHDEPSRRGAAILARLYAKWVPEDKIITTDAFCSELGKLSANCFLAQRISSINAMSAICERVGADAFQSNYSPPHL
eukprot:TRINITY_DN7866_c0_g1_i9.p1 TRINITY_DN7866_c0_g1~~TRINITY_DN7866_c0_g1_i9.p1  ORF type:complete len:295 (-),score=54.02 TRINITY_DN7866_c0_g1_i9:119-955(-)